MNIVHEIIQRIRGANCDLPSNAPITELVVTIAEADALRKELEDRYQEMRKEARDQGLPEPNLPWCTERGNSLLDGVEIIGR